MDDNIAVVQWHDKSVVSILMTEHNAAPFLVDRRSRHVSGGCKEVEKPQAVVEYNKYIGGVDQGDQLLSHYGFPHHNVRWWRQAFYYLLDIAIVNNYILYTKTT